MDKSKALGCLQDGHSIWKPEFAQKICETLGIKWSKSLVHKFKSDPVGTFKGLIMKEENAEGVDSGHLAFYCASQLGVANKAGDYFGRGSQARAYAEEVKKALEEKENVK